MLNTALMAQQSGGRGFETILPADGTVTGPFFRLEPVGSFKMSDFTAQSGATYSATTKTREIARTHTEPLYLAAQNVTLESGECRAYRSVL